jgi:uncharacterized protein
MPQSSILEITTGRVASVRLAPNEDLIEGLHQAAAQLGFRRALVWSGLGSLTDANFHGPADASRHIAGPGVEILALSGEIALDSAQAGGPAVGVSGLVGDTSGAVWSGRFVSGQNLVCVTVEAVLEEILVAP